LIDDFVIRALLGGLGVAVIAGPLGCFVVWRRMAYFGEALAHSALLGVAIGFLLDLAPEFGILACCVLFALALAGLEGQRLLATDTLLGILAHSALALGLCVLALVEGLRIDLNAYLFGDVLAVTRRDLLLIGAVAVLVLTLMVWRWRDLIAITVSEDLAAVEGVPVSGVRLALTLMIAAFIGIGVKVVGMLLIVSLLIIPAAAARRLSRTPAQMAVLAALAGMLAVAGGLAGSLRLDVPAGPAMVVAASLMFVLSMLVPLRRASRPH